MFLTCTDTNLTLPRVLGVIVGVIAASLVAADAQCIADDFEDGTLDPACWDWGCLPRSYLGPGGTWECTVAEVSAADGYMEAHVWGPPSPTGDTYGAEGWFRNRQDFNDGLQHVINFEWEVFVTEGFMNHIFIQITDGYISPNGHVHWTDFYFDPGTVDLLWRTAGSAEYPGQPFALGLPQSRWSVTIDPLGIASLYDAPDGMGTLLREEVLDPLSPWYFRLMIIDANSHDAANDASLRVFDYSAPPHCVGDIDGDGYTDVFDFSIFAFAFGSQPGDINWYPSADYNADNTVDVFDFGILAADFGCTP